MEGDAGTNRLSRRDQPAEPARSGTGGFALVKKGNRQIVMTSTSGMAA